MNRYIRLRGNVRRTLRSFSLWIHPVSREILHPQYFSPPSILRLEPRPVVHSMLWEHQNSLRPSLHWHLEHQGSHMSRTLKNIETATRTSSPFSPPAAISKCHGSHIPWCLQAIRIRLSKERTRRVRHYTYLLSALHYPQAPSANLSCILTHSN